MAHGMGEPGTKGGSEWVGAREGGPMSEAPDRSARQRVDPLVHVLIVRVDVT